jgi:hypothetical protein
MSVVKGGLTPCLCTIRNRRCLQFLGFDEYYESHTDGLQILRYNLTKAYTTHMDYLDSSGKRWRRCHRVFTHVTCSV